MSNPLSFNDPFDCSVSFDANRIINEIAKKNLNIIENTLDGFAEEELSKERKQIILTSQKPFDELNKYLPSLLGEDGMQHINSIYEQMYTQGCENFNTIYKAQLKVSCFSESNDSLLMWGHYANKHQGFCIEYDLSSIQEEDNFKKYLFPVEYVRDRFDMTDSYIDRAINKLDIQKEALIDSVLYKSEEWEYEKEWRIIITSNEYEKNSFITPKPKAIYLGSNIEKINKTKILEIANKNKIQVFQMRLDYKSYKISPKYLHEIGDII